MGSYTIKFLSPPKDISIKLNSSKSESNRLIIIKALSKEKIEIKNLSNANDTSLLNNLINFNSTNTWNAEDAGTSMRFLTSYLSLTKNGALLTGTDRMKKRPIKILVEALREIGANILYKEEEGYPPINIKRKIVQKINNIDIRGDVSSQYISSILMIAPKLENGLGINIINPFYSKSYVKMTLSLMEVFGIKYLFSENQIIIKSQDYKGGSYTVESDWSAASYWYSILSINKDIDKINLIGLRNKSLQGDQIIAKIMSLMGIVTNFNDSGIEIRKNNSVCDYLELDFKDCPDLAQTVLIVASYHKIKLKIYGVESLKIKETDRLTAMKNELHKIGVSFYKKENFWILDKRKKDFPKSVSIDTYKDHRMAMAFAPLASEIDITINNPEVVKKSYPMFWDDMKKVGYSIT
ncbi:MAG: 3-phosphoshikimate 1-carboxyvinyltransferase [Rhodothermaeota bacterium MED-G19]|nr:MAG: 3-phosphoshikimate 1-carboxyvinyltransferase [Rhodothermaeota bacterium MED-G19]